MKRIVLVLFILLSLQNTFAQKYSKKELKYKPQTLEEAIEQLKKIHHDSTKTTIVLQQEVDFVSRAHFSMGGWVRNKWDLWKRKGLTKNFNEMGVFHPDDMSSIILTCYYRELKGLDWELQEQIKGYQKYWEEREAYLYRLETDAEFVEKELERVQKRGY